MKRGTKYGIAGLVVASVMAGGLVIADRIAVDAAEDRIADEAQRELESRSITASEYPEVDITGFPFLTQVFAGEYQAIDIHVDRPSASGVSFTAISVTALTVRADTRALLNGAGQVTAAEVDGVADLDWDGVRQALDIVGVPGIDAAAADVRAEDDQVRIEAPLELSGASGVLIASGELTVVSGAIQLAIADLRIEGLPESSPVQQAVSQYQNGLVIQLAVPEMPYQLVVTEVQTDEQGISVFAEATDVVLVD